MTTISKGRRFLLGVCLGLILLAVAFFWLAASGGSPRYRAESVVMVSPYTNAFFSRAFEENAISKIPGVFRLEVMAIPLPPSNVATLFPGKAISTNTNRVMVRIFASGATAQAAQDAANEAARHFHAFANELYGSQVEVVENARQARPYSKFREVEARIQRMFKR